MMRLRGPDQTKRVLRISPTAENRQLPATGALIVNPLQLLPQNQMIRDINQPMLY